MYRIARLRQSSPAILAILLAGASSAALLAQEGLPPEFQTLHDKLTKPGVILSPDQGRAALDQFGKLGLNASNLPTEARIKLLRAECLAHLAVGDARSAAERAAALTSEAADAKETWESKWLVASAAGNAHMADEAGKQLARIADAEAKRKLSKRRRQLKAVARAAPPAQLNSSEDRSVALADRDGVVLVLDLWSLRDKPEPAMIESLRTLKSTLAGQSNIDLLSINIDAQSKREAAVKFIAETSYPWPTAFAASGEGDADLVAALDAGLPPYQVVIDAQGLVRAVGDLREPSFHYAVRAANAEARGDFQPLTLFTLDGKQSKPPANEVADSASEAVGSAADNPPPAAKPSNPEAAELLKQVRLYRKTGRYTDAKALCREIIERYPDTHEAEEADFYLRSMP